MFSFKKETRNPTVTFRQSLFWDVDPKTLDVKKHSRYIINRILDRGDITDFLWAKKTYGKERLKEETEKSKILDRKSQNFWCSYFNIESNVCMKKPSPLEQSPFWTR